MQYIPIPQWYKSWKFFFFKFYFSRLVESLFVLFLPLFYQLIIFFAFKNLFHLGDRVVNLIWMFDLTLIIDFSFFTWFMLSNTISHAILCYL